MSEKVVQINVPGPESIVVSEEERFELIAQVARALEERRQAKRDRFDNDWDKEDSVFDFSKASFDLN